MSQTALEQAQESASAAWECLDMTREVFAAVTGEPKDSFAPMFFPETVRALLFRAACGDFDGMVPEDSRATLMAKRRRALLTVAP